METLSVTGLMMLASLSAGHPQPQVSKPVQVAMTCIKSGEETSGQNKVCYYNCAGSRAAVTEKSFQVCPQSVDR